MAILPILCYPDPRLHKIAQPVAVVDERVRAIVADMFATMYDAHGIGLAAGRFRRSRPALAAPAATQLAE